MTELMYDAAKDEKEETERRGAKEPERCRGAEVQRCISLHSAGMLPSVRGTAGSAEE